MKLCGSCEKPSLMKCAGCNVVRYCSKECQKHDWKYHRLACKRHANAKEIVDHIRNMVLDAMSAMSENEQADPWSEGKEGVNWIDNEIFFLKKMNPNAAIPNYENCETVAEARQILAEMNQVDLKFIHHFIVELGGTSEPYLQ